MTACVLKVVHQAYVLMNPLELMARHVLTNGDLRVHVNEMTPILELHIAAEIVIQHQIAVHLQMPGHMNVVFSDAQKA